MNIEKFNIFTQEDLYKNIEVNENDLNLTENGCFDKNLWNSLITNYQKDNIEICELGTWYGYGANRLANFLKTKNKNFKILCVDTWLGSLEHIFNSNGEIEYPEVLKAKNGFPTFYFDFLKVTKYFKNEKEIIPFVNTTICFKNICKKLNIKFDFIIIDASHQYDDVKIDLEISYDLLKDGGIIVGDDLSWEGVNKALNEFIQLKGNSIKNTARTHNQYILFK